MAKGATLAARAGRKPTEKRGQRPYALPEVQRASGMSRLKPKRKATH